MHKDDTNNPAGWRKRISADPKTLFAFLIFVIFIGANSVAVRFSNIELEPFWGAAFRLFLAGTLFVVYIPLARLSVPRGRALVGVVIYGILQFGTGISLIYWSLQELPAGVASVVLASIPLFTLLFAYLARIEPLTIRGVAGTLVAMAGIAVIFSGGMGGDVAPAYFLAAVGASAVFALVGVIIKIFPRVHPAMSNGLGMFIGAPIVLLLALVNGESIMLPAQKATWLAVAYLVLPGSIGAFVLLIFLLGRWKASAVSYQSVLSPLATIALSVWLLDESVTIGLAAGALLVFVGVYLGVITSGKAQPVEPHT